MLIHGVGKLKEYFVFVWLTYDTIYLFVTILTYSYLYYKVKMNWFKEIKILGELQSQLCC